MSGAEIEAKILEALKNAPNGITQIQINRITGVDYASFVSLLKENAAKVTSKGERKGMKVFIK
jgi:hypothetical protein